LIWRSTWIGPLHAAGHLGAQAEWPVQYQRAVD
jgi:hypothetical protein